MPEPDAQPLAGIRVLDFTQNLPGPYATMVLRSLGAEVIKIEPPRGDTARTFPRLFEIVNAGKKSVVLDLKDPGAQASLRELVGRVDVVVEGFRPGVMARLGCDAEAARELNPRLVYCSISGYGQAGPYRDHPGHDLNFQALTGVCHMLRDERGRPLGAALPIADLSSSLTAVTGILAALLGRERTGRGRVVDIAMVDTLLSWAYVWSEGLTPSDARLSSALGPAARVVRSMSARTRGRTRALLDRVAATLEAPPAAERADALGDRLMRSDRWQRLRRLRLHALPHYTIYRTRDHRWLSIGIVDEDKFWAALCTGLGLPALARIPLMARFAAAVPLRRAIAHAIARRDLAHWLETLDREAIPIAPVLPLDEALEDPQLRLRRPPGAPIHVPWPLEASVGTVPKLGEHTDAVLGSEPPKPDV